MRVRRRLAWLLCVLPLAGVSASGCSASAGSPSDGRSGAAGTPVTGGGGSVGSGGTPVTGGTGAAPSGGVPGVAGGGSGGSMLKGPLVRENKCVWEFGDVFFQVDPFVGGRMLSARIGASELLSGPAVSATNYGSTFWTSPQSDWNWPPLAEIDSAPYTPTTVDAEASCTMVGAKVNNAARANVHEVSVTKKFSPDFARQALVVDYTIHNQGAAAKRLAPWEITRVAADGLTFYGADAAPFVPAGLTPVPPTLPVTSAAGCVWFKYDAAVPHNAKLYGDGKGWIAHVTPQNLLLVKTFTDVSTPQFAPREAEIEIYASNSAAGRYVEVENQGAQVDIAPGQTSTWSVRWFLRTLPSGVTATAGNPALVQFVQQTIQ